ncbi:MAG: outer membrane protein assembly factor BamA, partial [Cocleimonas sp.]
MKNQVMKASLAGCLIALAQGVWADSFVLKDVQVSGLDRITAGTVLSKVPVRVGQTFDDRMSSGIVRSLFKTGLFDDVKISRRGGVLLVKVHERSAVGDIKVTGNHAIETPALLAALKQAGIAKGRPLNKSALNRIQREIKQQYISRGNYAANVETSLQKLPRNRVGVNINIKEGSAARIHRFNISGNKAYSDASLNKLLDSGTKGNLSFFSSRDKYSKEKLGGDIEKLTSFYRDRGYLNFQVLSNQVALSKDKKSVYVNLNIHEGDQYRIGKVKVAGNSGINKNELQRLVRLKEGQVFSQSLLAETRQNLKSRMGKDGFAYSRIGIIPQVDKINKRV